MGWGYLAPEEDVIAEWRMFRGWRPEEQGIRRNKVNKYHQGIFEKYKQLLKLREERKAKGGDPWSDRRRFPL